MDRHFDTNRPIDAYEDSTRLCLQIGAHTIDFGALRVVTRPDAARLTSKSAAVLLELARHSGDVVTREALLDRVWQARNPTQDVVTHAISELRKVLGDALRPPTYIETISGVGYRLLAPVRIVDAPGLAAVADVDAGCGAPVGEPSSIQAGSPVSPPGTVRVARWLVAAVVLVAVVALAVFVSIR